MLDDLLHYVDMRNINDYAERGDFTKLACNTVWLDQMIQFCSRRKAKMGSFTSFKLDDIAYLTAKVHKLDYSHITNNLIELPYLDYKTFVLYNIIDVVNQKCIEAKSQDLEYIFAKCVVNCTTYAKGHRQTVYLINRMCKEWAKQGLIIGNNGNKWNQKPEKFQGALVENPLTTSDYSKIKISGIPIMLCDNALDFDFKSLYPSLMIEFNIAPNTQVGRVDIWNTWKVEYNGHVLYAKDPGVAYEFPMTEIDNKPTPKKIQLFIDEECTEPAFFDKKTGQAALIEYKPEEFKTISYDKFYHNENLYHNEKYSRAGEFMENLVCDNHIEFCKRWLCLGGILEVLEDWSEYQKNYLKFYGNGEPYYGYFHYEVDTGRLLETPLVDVSRVKAVRPIVDFNEVGTAIIDFRSAERCGVDLDDAKSRVNGVYNRSN